MNVKIRSAVLSDTNHLTRLAMQMGYEISDEYMQTQLRSILESEDHGVFVAESDTGNVLGWIHVLVLKSLIAGRGSLLGGLVVSENHRSQGIGSKLLKQAEEWTIQRGLPMIRLRSNIIRDRAHQFYQHNGYKVLKKQIAFKKLLSEN